MVEIAIDGTHAQFTLRGIDKLWALTSSLRLPLASVREVRADPDVARSWRRGLRVPGLHVPGLITAGTFYQDGRRLFWDVRNPANVVVIELTDERYDALVVEVTDPAAAVRTLEAARGPR